MSYVSRSAPDEYYTKANLQHVLLFQQVVSLMNRNGEVDQEHFRELDRGKIYVSNFIQKSKKEVVLGRRVIKMALTMVF